MPHWFRRALTRIKPLLEWLLQAESRLAAGWAASAHHRLHRVQWGLAPTPEHFDHSIDLYAHWRQRRSSFWIERGVFGGIALKPNADLLELACGDGFFASQCFSARCRSVLACDFDPKAIETARRKNSAPNVIFLLADIRTAMPAGQFDNIVWDAAIEHFTPAEITAIMSNIRARLKNHGVLSGYTIVEKKDGGKHLVHHEYEFRDKEDLRRFLSPHFRRVTVFETLHPERHNLYFWASDGPLPFDEDWPHLIRHRA
jgi:SAM-dependent methyltransferase